MAKKKLKNGLTVIHKKTNDKSVAVEVMFKVGSNYEPDKWAGISHFIEHMMFEGTKNRNAHNIVKEIEQYGGEINAATSHDRTLYYIKIQKKHFEKALEILSDMLLNSLFDHKIIEKERGVILSEINMITDDPKQYQWLLLFSNLFKKNNTKRPIIGFKKTVEKLKRKDFLYYINQYYAPNNCVVSVVGDVKNVFKKVVNIARANT
ncbi:M16 family metallopeptidase, partial [Nanoarchaeota archaeon]